MIDKTKELVEEKYTIANGYKHDAKVQYPICHRKFSIKYSLQSDPLIRTWRALDNLQYVLKRSHFTMHLHTYDIVLFQVTSQHEQEEL